MGVPRVRRLRTWIGCLPYLVLIAGCGGGGSDAGSNSAASGSARSNDPPAPAPAPAPTPTPTPKQFTDVTLASGIDYRIGYVLEPPPGEVSKFATGGVAAGDYDADGDIDLFITRGDIGPNLLYRNNGAAVFADVAAQAGVAFTATPNANYRHSGPVFADMDGDGDLDLFIGGLFGDPSFIFANNGDGTFTDVTAGSGIDSLGADFNISAAFGDYDLDGDLDLFVSHWGQLRVAAAVGDTEHLWRNDSTPARILFTSISVESGISDTILQYLEPATPGLLTDLTFTPTFARIDADLFPDILSVADIHTTRFFHNNGDGTFTDATDPLVITDGAGMGSALGDYDHDGDLDWFVSAIYSDNSEDDGNRLYRNDGGQFVDVTDAAGVRDGSWGWGACFTDFENDGYLDIYHTNGWGVSSTFETDRSVAFKSLHNGQFEDRAANLGLDDTEEGRGVVCADFDNDGDTDIFQLHRGSPVSATLWRNELSANNYLKIKLNGRAPNTEAAGARIFVTIGGTTQMREITIGNNFVSQNPTVQLFGLGAANQVDELRVEWPDGAEEIRTDVAAG
jgi:enediyne biosynthesis protein E4